MATTNPPPPAQRSRQRTQQPPPDTARILYFAYGSNLHVAQMAKRCPESLFMGKATLPGYRWQINQRGVANVVEAGPNFCVKGLVYAVTPKDRRALDKSEGVAKELYLPLMLSIEFEANDVLANSASSELARRLEERYRDVEDPDLSRRDRHFRGNSETMRKVTALVYVSENFKNPGPPRAEYILRMKRGAADAKALGVSRTFLNEAIIPILNNAPSASNTLSEYTWVKAGSNSQPTPQPSDRTPSRRRADPGGRPEAVTIEPRPSRPGRAGGPSNPISLPTRSQPAVIPVQAINRRRDGARVVTVEPTRAPPPPSRAVPMDRLALEAAEREQAQLEQARERYERRRAREEPLPAARESVRERRARDGGDREAGREQEDEREPARVEPERPSAPRSPRKANNGNGNGNGNGNAEREPERQSARKTNNGGNGGGSEQPERPTTARKANNGNGSGNGNTEGEPRRPNARKVATTTTAGDTTALPSRPRQQAGNDGAQT
ncbi:hypothetical protein C8A01DRAFT_31834 [Parachaetomium inaequale]|uniref:gamma-glutamylcyclotransferase n=1 Tax=Parachaetomium inaequale TaxID=2588326 RepID=A0AAN6PMZ3_9PEZI|nr:hypothetical protein C8A01DRAFT_31834 [Parachaetomium inaequale]